MPISTSNISSRINIQVRRGDTFNRSFNLNKTGTGIPEDLTGCVFAMTVKDGSGNAILAMTPTISGGTVTISKAAAQMLVPAGNYQYDLTETLPNASQVTRMHGFFIIDRDTTE